jgi:hypothetical protein
LDDHGRFHSALDLCRRQESESGFSEHHVCGQQLRAEFDWFQWPEQQRKLRHARVDVDGSPVVFNAAATAGISAAVLTIPQGEKPCKLPAPNLKSHSRSSAYTIL